jgi:hypothetical protein
MLDQDKISGSPLRGSENIVGVRHTVLVRPVRACVPCRVVGRGAAARADGSDGTHRFQEYVGHTWQIGSVHRMRATLPLGMHVSISKT